LPRQRRTQLEIDYELLLAVRDEVSLTNNQPKRTRLQARAYLNWKALNRHLERLRSRELLSNEGLSLTEKGRRFVNIYSDELKSILQDFGF